MQRIQHVETGYKPGLATNYQNTLRSISWAIATTYSENKYYTY